MLSFLPRPLLGTLSAALVILNLVFWIIPFYIVALAKIIVPVKRWRIACTRALATIGELWIDGNSAVARLHSIKWDIRGVESLERDDWYLVIANHQSWADIFVIQQALNRRVPFLNFFIKKQLIWVPLLGLAWWAMDMPFMQRHSREAIAKNPDLRRQDLEETMRACRHFSERPTSITNFVEGTRFAPAKHAAQDSPYRHLLRPKAGGLAFAIAAMGPGTLRKLLRVLIAYPPSRSISLWQLLSGDAQSIHVHVEAIEIPQRLREGDYQEDPTFRKEFQDWVHALWQRHDEEMAGLLEPDAPAGERPAPPSGSPG